MIICFVCTGGPNYPWAGCSFNDGIGGSETCLIRLAREFALLGHYVYVFNNCKQWAGEHDGVEYVDIEKYREAPLPDIADLLISWRDWYPLIGREAKQKWHSTHDIPVGCHHPCEDEMNRPVDNALRTIDRIVYLNNYHRGLSSWWPDDHSLVIPVGVETERFEVMRDPVRCITLFHPNRGLDQLHRAWPRVRQEVPDATLTSYWWEPEHFRPPSPGLGIAEMKRLDQRSLLRECFASGVAPYPSVFGPEISPVSTILPQVAGCYPVVVKQGGMVDTVQYGTDTTHEQFAEALVWALRQSRAAMFGVDRLAMRDWAVKTYAWENVAERWITERLKSER